MASRKIRGNGVRVAGVVGFGPDAFSQQAASLGLATNTFSPMSAGRHSPGASARGFVGDRGFGVNRWSGEYPYEAGSVQNLMSPIAPIANPKSRRLGANFGASGQPGFPSTGQDNSGVSALAYLGYGQLSLRTKLGG